MSTECLRTKAQKLAQICTSYMRQYDAMQMTGATTPGPKNQVLKDITAIICEWRDKHFHPIVMGDFNSEPRDKDMADFIERNNLHDLINGTNDASPPRTHTEGPRQIDYILGDRHVRDAIIKSGSLGESDELFSDHTL